MVTELKAQSTLISALLSAPPTIFPVLIDIRIRSCSKEIGVGLHVCSWISVSSSWRMDYAVRNCCKKKDLCRTKPVISPTPTCGLESFCIKGFHLRPATHVHRTVAVLFALPTLVVSPPRAVHAIHVVWSCRCCVKARAPNNTSVTPSVNQANIVARRSTYATSVGVKPEANMMQPKTRSRRMCCMGPSPSSLSCETQKNASVPLRQLWDLTFWFLGLQKKKILKPSRTIMHCKHLNFVTQNRDSIGRPSYCQGSSRCLCCSVLQFTLIHNKFGNVFLASELKSPGHLPSVHVHVVA